MINLKRVFLFTISTLWLIFNLTSPCFSQVEVSICGGVLKNFSSISQKNIQGPSGTIGKKGSEGTLSLGLQASIPINETFHLQSGIKVMEKEFIHQHVFNYPNQFNFSSTFINWGYTVELPISLIYELSNQFLGSSFKLISGVTISKNRIDRMSYHYNMDVSTSADISYSFDHKVINRENFLTPGFEAGLEISPILLKNFNLRFFYHHDLTPAYGGINYKNKFYYTGSLPYVFDEPEGIIKAGNTSYFMLSLSYNLPFFKNTHIYNKSAQIENE